MQLTKRLRPLTVEELREELWCSVENLAIAQKAVQTATAQIALLTGYTSTFPATNRLIRSGIAAKGGTARDALELLGICPVKGETESGE